MASRLQLLINEGELNEILSIISAAKDPESKIVGSLYGLWRNSLTQPVVQLAVGPGANGKISRKSFSPDGLYHDRITEYLDREHGLSQLGLWCSGSANRYSRLNRNSPNFNLQNPLMPRRGRYVVLMFVDYTRGNLEIKYEIIDRSMPRSARNFSLIGKDVLPGPSNFRLLRPVFDTLNRGAWYPARQNQHQSGYFSTSMLHHEPPPPHHQAPPRRSVTPSNAIPSTVNKQASQWYLSDGGNSLLQTLVNQFKSHHLSVDITRNANSHDLTLEIDRRICLHFPADFPTGRMSITWLNDTSKFTRNADEICNTILKRSLEILSYETAVSLSYRSRQTAC